MIIQKLTLIPGEKMCGSKAEEATLSFDFFPL